ncbi:MAG: SDR family NAD(P)-dependent oxidoreductase, partial [Tissierellia bacterium]|nr:SDR family NAD(P)-dependent oxidoreductase [Tissierellia bacterium]
MFELTDKVIIITGASSGIGKSCAIRCSMQGAKIALIGRDERKLKETLLLLPGKGHHIYVQDIILYD